MTFPVKTGVWLCEFIFYKKMSKADPLTLMRVKVSGFFCVMDLLEDMLFNYTHGNQLTLHFKITQNMQINNRKTVLC